MLKPPERLQAIADTWISRQLGSADTDRIPHLEGLVFDEDGNPQSFEEIAEKICGNDSPACIQIVGERGSGKSWALFSLCKEVGSRLHSVGNRLQILWVDLGVPSALAQLENLAKSTTQSDSNLPHQSKHEYIVFVRTHSKSEQNPQHIRTRIRSLIPGRVRSEIWTFRQGADRFGSLIWVGLRDWSSQSIETALDAYATPSQLQRTSSSRHTIFKCVLGFCQTYRQPPDCFFVQLACWIEASEGRVLPLSRALKRLLDEYVALPEVQPAGRPSDIRKKFEETAFRRFVSGKSPAEFDDAVQDNENKLISAKCADLLSQHPSIGDWLTARFSLFALKGIRKTSSPKPEVQASTSRAHARNWRLYKNDMVYPNRVNAFTKELLSEFDTADCQRLGVELLRCLSSDSDLSPLGKTHACYVAGRLVAKVPQLRDRLVTSLRAIATEVATSLRQLDTLSQAVSQLANVEDLHLKRMIYRISSELRHVAPNQHGDPPSDIGRALIRIRTRLVLLERSALISLAYLNEEGSANAYLDIVRNSERRDQLNSGFYIAYYGDADLKPGTPLMHKDEPQKHCYQTVQALVDGIDSEAIATELKIILVYTLASLLRRRNVTGKLEDGNYSTGIDRLREWVSSGREIGPLWLPSYLATCLREIDFGKFAVEAYIDDLYSLKCQRRVGWGLGAPRESVAAHSYAVYVLGTLLIGDDEVHKRETMRLVEFHDLGEAVVGDATPREKRADPGISVAEGEVVSQLGFFGLLTGSQSFAALKKTFDRFERREPPANQEKAWGAARELDRLDLLIELRRRQRAGVAVPEERDFEEYVKNFRVFSEQARRLNNYFAGPGKDRDTEAMRRLWGTDALRVRSIDD